MKRNLLGLMAILVAMTACTNDEKLNVIADVMLTGHSVCDIQLGESLSTVANKMGYNNPTCVANKTNCLTLTKSINGINILLEAEFIADSLVVDTEYGNFWMPTEVNKLMAVIPCNELNGKLTMNSPELYKDICSNYDKYSPNRKETNGTSTKLQIEVLGTPVEIVVSEEGSFVIVTMRKDC